MSNINTLRMGWNCPNCGKAHTPECMTCPEPSMARQVYGLPVNHYPNQPHPSWGKPFQTASGITSNDVLVLS